MPSRLLSGLLTFFVVSGLACAEEEQAPPPAECKARWVRADAALNQAWSSLKKTLPPEEFVQLQELQRDWLKQRDLLALSPGYSGAPGDEKEAKQSSEYFLTLAELTTERSDWLNAYAKPLENNSLSGVWNDSNGGSMHILQKEGKFRFSISVVRGPTAHVGDIGGIASWKSPKGFFTDKGIDPDKKDETTLTFTLNGNQLALVGSNTLFYHGARAYFDGSYLRIRPLEASEEKNLLENNP